MTEAIKKSLRDSKTARWTALAIVSFTMLCGYFFTEIISPLKPMLETQLGWDSADFGSVTSAYGWFNVFLFMLVIGGIILDKMGIRFTSVTAAIIMVIGAGLKYFAIHFMTADTSFQLLFWEFRTQVFWASIGYAVFGVGVEIAGITVSKIIVKWFKGKEMALAMGLEMACARLGTFAALAFSQPLATAFENVSAPILLGLVLLCIGLITFIIYYFMDVKIDRQIKEASLGLEEDHFSLRDIGFIIRNRGFWYIALLCVLFYSAVFPFYKYGPDLMVNKFGIHPDYGGLIPSLLPFGTLFLTPFFGNLYDRKGKGASIMLLGAIMLIVVHLVLWMPVLGQDLTSIVVAVIAVVVLGIAFSLVPSAMWPSVPKIIPEKQLGTAYALIFWVQNWGLMGIPFLLGLVLNTTNPTVATDKQAIQAGFELAYVQAVENTGLAVLKDKRGDQIDLAKAARVESQNLVTDVVMNYPQDDVLAIDSAELASMVYESTKTFLDTEISRIDMSRLEGVDEDNNEDNDNVVLIRLNESAVDHVSQVVGKKEVKLNYDYFTTWIIFIVCTILALIFAILLKREDKRKGYGLEKPNIER